MVQSALRCLGAGMSLAGMPARFTSSSARRAAWVVKNVATLVSGVMAFRQLGAKFAEA